MLESRQERSMTTVPRGTVVTECVWNLDRLLVAGLDKSRSTGDDDQESWNPDRDVP